MNRKRFIGLIIMMLLSIVGIIWVQIVWIRNAIAIRNDAFNNIVVASINDAANAIESSRKMSFFNDFLVPDPNPSNEVPSDISSYFSMGSYSSGDGANFSVRITNQSVTQAPGQNPVVITHDTTITSDSSVFIMKSPDDPGKMVVVKSSEVSNNGSGNVYMKQNDFVEWVKKKQGELQNMSDQMISEIYQWEKTMELDNDEINYALKRSFLFSNIQTPFEFAIIKNGKVTDL
jgi:two-component system phosphate regulon sensor histidine kinase PhoR